MWSEPADPRGACKCQHLDLCAVKAEHRWAREALRLGHTWASLLPLFLFQTLQVIYPYTPQNDDELELSPGDFIFMSPMEQTSTSEGWVYGTSLSTGCSGLLPENYITKADECSTWIFHG